MKFIVALLLALLFNTQLGSYSQDNKSSHEFFDIYEKIQLLNYSKLHGYSDHELFMIATYIEATCRAYNVNQYLMIAVFEVESKFGTKKLRITHHKPTDFGWGQLHIQHFTKLKLDGVRLLEDDAYSIERSVLFMAAIQKQYSLEDSKFYSRYHSYTPALRTRYEGLIRDSLAIFKVKKLKLGFQIIIPDPLLCDLENRGNF